MAGTREGGLAAAATNRAKYGDGKNGREDFYKSIGRLGGTISRGGGFQLGSEAAKIAGAKGGRSKRRPAGE